MGGGLRRNLPLSTTMLIEAMAYGGRRAYAQQVCAQQGATSNFVCDCPSVDTQDLTFGTTGVNNTRVTTGSNFSVDTTAVALSRAIEITGDATLSYIDVNSSPLMASGGALVIFSNGDDGTTPASVKIVPLVQDSALFDAGLDFAPGPGMTLGASYSGQIASDLIANAVKGRFTWLF